MLKNTATSYGSITKFLHWTIALLIIGMLIFGYFLDDFSNRGVYNIHKLIGLSILLLVAFRIVWTLYTGRPKLGNLPRWERISAYITEGLLYICMVCMPLFGWIGSSYFGFGPHLFNIPLGLPVIPNHAYGQFFMDLHKDVAIILIVLISFHAAGAFKHLIINRDRIMQRMLPFSQND